MVMCLIFVCRPNADSRLSRKLRARFRAYSSDLLKIRKKPHTNLFFPLTSLSLDSHENAAHAIVALNGVDIGGRPARVSQSNGMFHVDTQTYDLIKYLSTIQLSWGKDRAPGGGGAAYGAGAYGYGSGGGGGGGYHQQQGNQGWHQQGYTQAPAAGPGANANGQWDQYYQQYYGQQQGGGGYQ